MTRDEAVRIVKKRFDETHNWYETFVDALVALDLLKVENPGMALRGQAMAIADRFTRSGRDLHEMFHEFDLAGLAIVRKEDIK